jgi:glycosyltransferase involved in cell wall biosynthesis
VIPTRNSSSSIEACLRSILAQGHECEIIISDSSSADGTSAIAEKHGAKVLQINATPPAARNYGFSKAGGDIFLSLDSDMVLEPGLLAEVENGIAGHGALVLPEKGHGKGFLSECKMLEKRIYLSSSAEAARAFSREAFEAVGGYSEQMHFGEDWDLHGRIAEKFSIGRTSAGVLHDTSGLSLPSLLAKSYRYGKSLPQYLESGGSGRFLSTRKNFISGALSMIPSKPVPALGLLALKGMEYAAGTAGFVAGKIQAR